VFDTAWDEGLDEAQLEAATHAGEEPLVVVAGAGTGKTRTLVSRVAWLLERGTPPERILLLTFTRRAADEMLARAAALVGAVPGAARPDGGTFHAMAHRFVSLHAGSFGLANGFSVLDPAEASDVMDLVREPCGLDGDEVRVPRPSTLVEIYSRCVNTQRQLREVLAVDYPWCEAHLDAISDLFGEYTARKRSAALLDFDDLLLYWRALLAHDQVGASVASRYDHVLVDEYQDVNSLQVDIVRALRPSGRGLTVVGDDAQAIYGFRGSDSRHMCDLAQLWPNARVVRLERNFRSRQPLLDLANVVRPGETGSEVRLHSHRKDGARPRLARCHDVTTEARTVAEAILEAHGRGRSLRDQAVLVRAAHHSDLIEVELTIRRIPYRKYGGLRFLEAAHVKDLVAAGRLLDNSHDVVSCFRILRLHEKVGPSRARSMLAALNPKDDDLLARWPDAVALAPATARAALARTFDAMVSAREAVGAAARMQRLLEVLRPLVMEHYSDAHARVADLERLADSAAGAPDFSSWITELVLDPPRSTGDLAGPPHIDDDYLVVSTIHSAKGLEWPVVHLPHLVDGAFPSDMALGSDEGLAEERRLFYVAVTRARDELYLYMPLRMHHRRRSLDDRHGFALASRFLDPPAISKLDVVEIRPRNGPPAPAARPSVRLEVDVGSLWS
jgi:DNA helicase-2/ATP-dependent DNA helicase PcrA